MSEENEFIFSKDGLRLYLHHWSVDSPKAVLCLIHGLGEHGGRYEALASFMNQSRISVIALDLRGHGLSEGRKGHIKSYELVLSDIEETLKLARSEYLGVPMFLYGHSLGGNLVANYVKTNPTLELSGFILSSPFFKTAFEPPAWKVGLAKMMGKILPGLVQGSELDVSGISSLHEEVEKYQSDPLVHDLISVRLFLDATHYGQEVLANSNPLKIPGLAYHGDSDKITSLAATKEFVGDNSDLVEFHEIKGTFHEPHNDVSRVKVHEMILEFISKNRA